MPARGSFVDFCIAPGEYRPALVVREWTSDCAQLQVFPDKANDGPDPFAADWFRSSAMRDYRDAIVGTWRELPVVHATATAFWPARCTCADVWVFAGTKPPCPVHGKPASDWVHVHGPFEFKAGDVFVASPNVTATAVPPVYETPTAGYPR